MNTVVSMWQYNQLAIIAYWRERRKKYILTKRSVINNPYRTVKRGKS